MNTVAFYDTKPYDRDYFARAPDAGRLRWQFHEFRLSNETAASVDGARPSASSSTTGSTRTASKPCTGAACGTWPCAAPGSTA